MQRNYLIILLMSACTALAMEEDRDANHDLENNGWHILINHAIDEYNRDNEAHKGRTGYSEKTAARTDNSVENIGHIKQRGLRWPYTVYPYGYRTGQYVDINNVNNQQDPEHVRGFWESAPRVVVYQSTTSDDHFNVAIDTRNIERNYHARQPYINQHPIKCMLAASLFTGIIAWLLTKIKNRNAKHTNAN